MEYVTTIEKGKYDFALLHVDQQSIYNPVEHQRISKGRLFMELKEQIQEVDPDLPIVVINHMTPFHDTYETTEVVQRIKKMTEGCIMICNSYMARQQWGWGEVITHGLNPDDWGYDVPHFLQTGERIVPSKEPRCVIVLSPKGMENAYRRTFLTETLRYLEEMKVPYTWVGITKKFNTWDDYRDFMARSLVHFFPAWQSPRPRSRTEGMLSSQCIVTTPYQDASTFIKTGRMKIENGVTRLEYDADSNGFLTSFEPYPDPSILDNPEYAANLIRHLVLERPDIALDFGKRARKFAEKEFNHHVYEKQWEDFLKRHNLRKE
jgi:hypothetical protein